MALVFWTDEKVALLRKLRSDDGLSCSEIASQIGTSRNAVIGKLTRLGMPGKPRLTPDRQRKERARPAEAAARFAQRLISATPLGTPFACREIPVGSLRKSIVDLAPLECRYPDPEGDPVKGIAHTFCGNDTFEERCPYCPAHTLLVVGQGTPGERAASRVSKRQAA